MARDQSAATRPVEQAFVVRFRPPTDAAAPEHLAGRIEHVHSGREIRFDSYDTMLDFMRTLLAGTGDE